MPQTFPFYAWVLRSSYEITKVHITHGGPDFYTDDAGKLYRSPSLFSSKKAALKAGWTRIARQEQMLAESAERIAKRKQALAQYSADL
ncbi:hypothetical protein [Pseudomonas thivervalensis]|uniref:hypothetical protein n=1 Tax=Pseudomonas thivervalensis TaxID=86265 RepID=UPI00069E4433|nr:hypothetical protein [Pseudomonas thivervalensis]